MFRVYLINTNQRLTSTHGDGPLELGRSEDEPGAEVKRIVVRDQYASRNHLRVTQPTQQSLRFENISQGNPLTLANGTKIDPGDSLETSEPLVRLTMGQTQLDFEIDVEDEAYRTIARPVRDSEPDQSLHELFQRDETPDAATLAGWLETVVAVQRSAAGSAAFYEETAQAIVDLIGFDTGLVLLRRGEDWTVQGRHAKDGVKRPSHDFSRTILDRVLADKRTYYQAGDGSRSLAEVSLAAASPILHADTVAGAVYGTRSRGEASASMHVSPLEAQLLQVLAAAVSAGMARMKHETEAVRRRRQFEQFMSLEISSALDNDPSLLEGRERELTILFADIRSFSRISSDLSPRETCGLVADVMGCVTPIISDHDGVVVDYIGDGLFAMWNAPLDVTDHAVMACRAAIEMQTALTEVSRKWSDRIDTAIRLGIGINSGAALVGNTGSKYRLKYGPLGHSVNLASRVEGATKQFGVPILISGMTRERVGDRFATRRLGRVRVVGIDNPVDLFELHGERATADWETNRDAYEAALSLFESGRWAEASQRVYPLLSTDGECDLPSLILAGRAIECLRSTPEPFDPILSLETK